MATTPEEKVAEIIEQGNPEKPVNGDCYDFETGDYLATLTDADSNRLTAPPFALDIFFNGHWYKYVAIERNKHEEAKTI